jgi:hypothetical protein
MAVSPLFFDTRDDILAQVRLGGMCETAAGQALVDRALLKVRNGFLAKLGSSRVLAIQAVPFTEAPLSHEEVERAKAQIIETEWLHAELLLLLPNLMLEGGSRGIDIYQDENPFRLDDEEHRSALTKSLMASVNEGLEGLSATDVRKAFRAALVEPDEEAPNTLLLLQPTTLYPPNN